MRWQELQHPPAAHFFKSAARSAQ